MIEAKSVPFEKRMTVGKVISFTFGKFFKEISSVGQWVLLMLAVALLNALPIGLLVASVDWSFAYMSTIGVPIDPMTDVNFGLVAAGSILMLVVLLFDIFFAIFSTAWFNRLGLDAYDGNKRTFGERFKLGLKDLWRLVAPVLLLTIFGVIVMIPYYIMNAINTVSAVGQMMGQTAPAFSPLELVFYLLGLIAAYYLSVKTSAIYGILLENPEEQVMDCFKRSFAMTKGRGWRIVGYYISLSLLLMLVIIAIFIPGIIGWVAVSVTNFNIGVSGFVIVLSILLYLVLIAFSVGLQGFFTAGIYKHLMIEHSEDVLVEMPEFSTEEGTAETTAEVEVPETKESDDTDPMA